MQTVPKRVFTHEYRAEAVKLVLAEGLGVTQAARKLGLSVKTLFEVDTECSVGHARTCRHASYTPVSDLQAEVSRLNRELAIACEKRDILKKATAHPLVRAVAALRSNPGDVRVHSAQPDER